MSVTTRKSCECADMPSAPCLPAARGKMGPADHKGFRILTDERYAKPPPLKLLTSNDARVTSSFAYASMLIVLHATSLHTGWPKRQGLGALVRNVSVMQNSQSSSL